MIAGSFYPWNDDLWRYVRYLDLRLRTHLEDRFCIPERHHHNQGIRLTHRTSKQFFAGLRPHFDLTGSEVRRTCLVLMEFGPSGWTHRYCYYDIQGVQMTHGRKNTNADQVHAIMMEICEEMTPTKMVKAEQERRKEHSGA